MLRVGLTGGIGSGKSEVSRRLAARGAVIIDADVAARQVVVPGSPGLTRIASAFGADVLRPDGSLDRDRLGAIVFADPGQREKLNAIVHPLVRQWMLAAERTAIEAASSEPGTDPGAPILIHDVPLLAESRGKGGFDLVIVVDAAPQLQVERLVRQRGMAPDQAQARMTAQASREQRLAVADIVIDNSGSLDDLDRRVGDVWAGLQRRSQDPGR
jgi:dephospho-CoA kinase